MNNKGDWTINRREGKGGIALNHIDLIKRRKRVRVVSVDDLVGVLTLLQELVADKIHTIITLRLRF